jgi:hypothetical protein
MGSSSRSSRSTSTCHCRHTSPKTWQYGPKTWQYGQSEPLEQAQSVQPAWRPSQHAAAVCSFSTKQPAGNSRYDAVLIHPA